MLLYVIRRLLQLIPMLLGITLMAFVIIKLSPGDFLSEMRLNPLVSPETIERMRENFGLNQPLAVQYLRWLWNAVRLDFGYSFAFQVPVVWLIGSRLFNTVLLNVVGFAVAWALAIPLGIYAARRQYSLGDNALSFAAYLGISTPTFFSGLFLLFWAFKTGWLPIGGMTSVDFEFLPWWGKVLDVAHHMVIPVLVVGVFSIAGLMRQMRAALLEVLRQDYVRTARAKGLREPVVINKHAVRNAINPIITIFGFELGGLLGGSAILENVVGWPGLGKLLVDATLQKDLYVVMAALVFGSVMLVVGNLIADVMLAFADPRVRYD
ncbi:MAG: ABC transporter permease [Armatimonadota bacterium]|nr:ABC transporter permease [Armatimonadota bacterium]MDR7422851.1 ABC transporter permease [Armatimonadota bacterium]MDR7455088.1 ABC transporter permease [Armatimonadota bacterium]MDR7497136.1 ABC transporter permease [Armatimonadota bacterium]MDR7512075.1 ABC transporter permease [Armatimonadota bacterium]